MLISLMLNCSCIGCIHCTKLQDTPCLHNGRGHTSYQLPVTSYQCSAVLWYQRRYWSGWRIVQQRMVAGDAALEKGKWKTCCSEQGKYNNQSGRCYCLVKRKMVAVKALEVKYFSEIVFEIFDKRRYTLYVKVRALREIWSGLTEIKWWLEATSNFKITNSNNTTLGVQGLSLRQ